MKPSRTWKSNADICPAAVHCPLALAISAKVSGQCPKLRCLRSQRTNWPTNTLLRPLCRWTGSRRPKRPATLTTSSTRQPRSCASRRNSSRKSQHLQRNRATPRRAKQRPFWTAIRTCTSIANSAVPNGSDTKNRTHLIPVYTSKRHARATNENITKKLDVLTLSCWDAPFPDWN